MDMGQTFYAAGIDGGGTKTECAIIDQDGKGVGVGLGGPSNICYADMETVLSSYSAAITSALRQAGDVQASIIGCTHRAVSQPEVVYLIERTLGGEVKRYSEGEAALGCAGIFERRGIVQIAGTGSSTFGFSGRGEQALIGGWGMLLGDEGGAYDIAIRGLRAAVRAMDGRGLKTALLDRACAHFGISQDREAFIRLSVKASRHEIAGFAVEVTSSARAGDMQASEIVEYAVHELVRSILVMAGKWFKPDNQFPVVLHGGVFRDEYIVEEVKCLINAEYPSSEVLEPIYSPGVGLALFALHDWKKREIE